MRRSVPSNLEGESLESRVVLTAAPGVDEAVSILARNASGATADSSVSEEAFVAADNSYLAPNELGVLDGTATYQDYVGRWDERDVFRFTMPRAGSATILLEELVSAADIYLLDADQMVLGNSTNTEASAEAVQAEMAGGEYFVVVESIDPWSATNYSLSITTVFPELPPDVAGADFATAFDIGQLPANQAFTDFVGYGDAADVFRFEVDSEADVTLRLSALTQDIDLYLFAEDESQVGVSDQYGSVDEAIDTRLAAGTYFATVVPHTEASSNYILTLQRPGFVDPTDPDPTDPDPTDPDPTDPDPTDPDPTDPDPTDPDPTDPDPTDPDPTDPDPTDPDPTDPDPTDPDPTDPDPTDPDPTDPDPTDPDPTDPDPTDPDPTDPDPTDPDPTDPDPTDPDPTDPDPTDPDPTDPDPTDPDPTDPDPTDPDPTDPDPTDPDPTDPDPTDPDPTDPDPTELPDVLPDVAYYGTSREWGLNIVNAPEAWAVGYMGQGVTVAVVDTGVSGSHIDLQDSMWVNATEIAGDGIDNDGNGYVDDVYGWDFVTDDGDAADGHGHGTHVAGTIAAMNNGIGATGVAYAAKIMPIRVLDNAGSGSTSDVARGIRYAVDNGADIINLSLGGGNSSRIYNALQYALEHDVLVVAASGNEGQTVPGYPARHSSVYANVLSIGAYSSSMSIASFSNRVGDSGAIQVDAPGVGIYSTFPNDQYGYLSGTSMATPHAAGVAALVLSANPNLTSVQLRDVLMQSATLEVTNSDSIGGVNAAVAVPLATKIEVAQFGTEPTAVASEFVATTSARKMYATQFAMPGRNVGVDHMGRDYVSVVDSDEVLEANYVKREAVSLLFQQEFQRYFADLAKQSDVVAMLAEAREVTLDLDAIFAEL